MENPFLEWGNKSDSPTRCRAFTLDDLAVALSSANLAVRGKPGTLLWAEVR